MIPRVVAITSLDEAAKEMCLIGSHPEGIKIMAEKGVWRAIKLFAVPPVPANIIKQEMLSLGGEAALARGSLNHSVKTTDVLLFGTIRQQNLLLKKLLAHQFGLPRVAQSVKEALDNYAQVPKPLRIGPLKMVFGKRTYLMGVLNVTPDSFSDGGQFIKKEDALRRAEAMIEEGADIIDIGGESTRPGARPVSAEEEKQRIIPVIKAVSRSKKVAVSVDTRKASVAAAAIEAGAEMINDVSGLRYDKKMAKTAAQAKVPVCLMHMRGVPQNMQDRPEYHDVMGEIINELQSSIAFAENAGILLGKLIVDPGFGFGKTPENNLEILNNLKELKVLGCPILIGPSRKSTIGKILGLPEQERVEGTAAAVAIAVNNGADIIRAHDVKVMRRVMKMAEAIARRS